MCGRAFYVYTALDLAERYLEGDAAGVLEELRPNYNLAPTQLAPVLRVEGGRRQIVLLRWGLVPQWAKDIASAAKYHLINARGEEIRTKRSYSGAFERRRCIVPVSGFIEWKREEVGTKRPFAIRLRGKEIMSLAGIWERWASATSSELVESFSIITTSANTFMHGIHDRMPVILGADQEAEWLDPETKNVERLQAMLRPLEGRDLEAVEISPFINSPKNTSPDVLLPIKKDQ